MKHRKGLSPRDRAARSRLHRLLERADGLIHGSLIRLERRCGNPNCRCVLKGRKHGSWSLGVSEKGRARMKHIPKDRETTIRRWVEQYRQVRGLIEEISQEAWKRLRQGKE